MGAILSLEVGSTTFTFGPMGVLSSDLAMYGWTSTTLTLNNVGASAIVRGINLGGMVSADGKCSGGVPLTFAATQSMVEGNPSTPSIALNYAGFWRFRWSLASGTRNITVRCKQVVNENPRPTITVEANPDIGLLTDVVGVASSSTGWVDIGPVTVTPTSAGAVWVKLRNNLDLNSLTSTPAYFDHIVVT